MIDIVNLKELARNRIDQPSYHLASEDYLRVQMYNLVDNDETGTWKCDGNVLITVVSGKIIIFIGDESEQATELCQVIILPGKTFRIVAADGPAVVQLVWSPSFAKIEEIKND